MAKSHVEAQQLISQKRLVAPQDNWKDEQWGEFWNTIGRPQEAGKYTLPKYELPEGLQFDDSLIGSFRDAAHKSGLTQKQFQSTMDFYVDVLRKQDETQKTHREAAAEQARSELKSQWGDRYDHNLDMAKAALSRFAPEGFAEFLDEKGLSNDPRLVAMGHEIAKAMMEDSATGKGPGLPVGAQAQAASEIDQLRADQNFMDSYVSGDHPMHKQAVARMEKLLRTAYPGKEPI